MDSFMSCRNKTHWLTYPYAVNYAYNSRGFRDNEWPDLLNNVVWCVGDSFTVGVGLPQTHTWPELLKNKLNRPTINVSMGGASNGWITRKVLDILAEANPRTIVIHWSYLHRRENTDKQYTVQNVEWQKFYNSIRGETWPQEVELKDFETLPLWVRQEIDSNPDWCNWRDNLPGDEALREMYLGNAPTNDVDIEHLTQLVRSIEAVKKDTQIIYSFIPEFAPADRIKEVELKIQNLSPCVVPYFSKLDLARDGHHYGVNSVKHFVDQVVKQINAGFV